MESKNDREKGNGGKGKSIGGTLDDSMRKIIKDVEIWRTENKKDDLWWNWQIGRKMEGWVKLIKRIWLWERRWF